MEVTGIYTVLNSKFTNLGNHTAWCFLAADYTLVLGHIRRGHSLECNDLHLDLSHGHDHDYGDLSVSVKGRGILVNRKKVVFYCIDDLQAYISRQY